MRVKVLPTESAPLPRVFQGNNEYLRAALAEKADLEPMDFGREINMDTLRIRERLVREFSWAIPNDDALDALEQLTEWFGPLLELGAGGGYWAYLLRERGVDILATDAGVGLPAQKRWTEVEKAAHTIVEDHIDRPLLFCWPSQDLWAAEALRLTHAERVVYIGEMGGCTADDSFHTLLCCDFKQAKRVEIPRWYGLHDYLSIWER